MEIRFIIVLTDHFTKWATAKPTKNHDADTVATVLHEEWICEYGAPDRLLTDQGSDFSSRLFDSLNRLLGIQRSFTSGYRPQTNGLVERFNGTLINILKTYTSLDQQDWDVYVKPALFAYRTAVHTATHETPFFLMHGWDPRTPLDVALDPNTAFHDTDMLDPSVDKPTLLLRIRRAWHLAKANLIEAARQAKCHYDQHRTPVVYQPGDLVWHFLPRTEPGKSRKLTLMWTGPYRILEQIQPRNYRISLLANPNVHRLVHEESLKPCKESTAIPTQVPREWTDHALVLDHISDDPCEMNRNQLLEKANDEYEIEAIVDARFTPEGKREFKVKWKGWTNRYNTWVQYDDLHADELLTAFLRSHPEFATDKVHEDVDWTKEGGVVRRAKRNKRQHN